MSKDPFFSYWLAGLVDGEGCFQVQRQDKTNGKVYYNARFSLALRSDDSFVIEHIKANIGFGGIYVRRKATGERYDVKDQILLDISKRDRCWELSEMLIGKLRSKKSNQLIGWRNAIIELQKGHDLANPLLLEYYWSELRTMKKYEYPRWPDENEEKEEDRCTSHC